MILKLNDYDELRIKKYDSFLDIDLYENGEYTINFELKKEHCELLIKEFD